jgi:molybdate/tungstate transport system substrate-binding protein
MGELKVFAAGVAARLAEQAAVRYKDEYGGAGVELEIGGSTAGIKKLIAREKYDVMILADSSNIDELLMPEYADGYFIWGGNEMVVAGKDITNENWKEKLLEPGAVITHRDPYGDPVGYRAVMAMLLADRVAPGLSAKLLNHPGYKGLDKAQYKKKAGEHRGPQPLKDGEYEFTYKSGAVSMGQNFASLPPEMNLGDPMYEEVYNSTSFEVSEGTTVRGTAIFHAIVIPKATENLAQAENFAKTFLANRFMMYGFTPVQRKIGGWSVKPPNMWDTEAKYYSMMTLMEVNGTNKQLDCIPMEPDFVVLDAGCGPGRVAIQAAKRVKKVICLDSSVGMLEECRKNCEAAGVKNVEFVLADWQEAEPGVMFPEVDVVIQSRGGGGPSSLSQLRKAARKYAVTIMWAQGAPNLPESRGKLFKDCFSAEVLKKYPELRPIDRRRMPPPPGRGMSNGSLFGGKGPVDMNEKLPMSGPGLVAELKKNGIEPTVATIDEGWDKVFSTREEAYDDLIALTRHPELVDMERYRKNVDSFLTACDGGFLFFLPTRTDITWFKTRQ